MAAFAVVARWSSRDAASAAHTMTLGVTSADLCGPECLVRRGTGQPRAPLAICYSRESAAAVS